MNYIALLKIVNQCVKPRRRRQKRCLRKCRVNQLSAVLKGPPGGDARLRRKQAGPTEIRHSIIPDEELGHHQGNENAIT